MSDSQTKAQLIDILSLEPKIREFLLLENQCVLCYAPLTFKIEFRSAHHEVRESAYCPTCGVRVRLKDHKMH